MRHIKEFFATARERYQIRLRRMSGAPRPWSEDPIFQQWRFCNVHREHDRNTMWLRSLTDEMAMTRGEFRSSNEAIVRAVVIFRWFNRIETAECLHPMLLRGRWNPAEAMRAIRHLKHVVTGAYMITSPMGVDKASGILRCIDFVLPRLEAVVPGWGDSLEAAWRDLKEYPFLGPFHAYEMVSDLRWTPVLREAGDIMTWANAGPGCARGIGRVVSGRIDEFKVGSAIGQARLLAYMQEILEMSGDRDYWPGEWRPWEMREVEHWACEWDKYVRAQGGARLKRRYE